MIYPDIPRIINNNGCTSLSLDTLLLDQADLLPVLYWLHQPVPTTCSLDFLAALQPIFCGSSTITNGTHRHLTIALDNLLRAVATKDSYNDYHHGKLAAAFGHVQEYLLSINAKNYAGEKVEYNWHELLTIPKMQLDDVISNVSDLNNDLNVGAIRLLIALYDQIRDISYCTERELS
jgi:hypothetical protein